MRNITSKPRRKNSSEDLRLQPLRSTWQEEKREENGKNEKRSRRKRKGWQVGGTKALRLVLLWILLGTRMHIAKAVEEEVSIRQETDCMLQKVPVPRAGDEVRWKRMRTCDRGRNGGRDWGKRKENKKKPGQGSKHL